MVFYTNNYNEPTSDDWLTKMDYLLKFYIVRNYYYIASNPNTYNCQHHGTSNQNQNLQRILNYYLLLKIEWLHELLTFLIVLNYNPNDHDNSYQDQMFEPISVGHLKQIFYLKRDLFLYLLGYEIL